MQPLVEKYRPKHLADFAGLSGPRAVLSKFAAGPYSAAWLLVGAAGTGKTTMAFALAEEIGGEIHHIPSRNCDLETVERTCASCHYHPWAGNWHTVIVDEADQMSRPAQLAFLSKLDSAAPPPDTVFLFTANDTALLEKRFISRTRVLRFSLESETASAIAYLERIWSAETAAPAPDFAALLRDSEYNLRDALMRIEIELVAPGSYRPNAETSPACAPVLARPSHRRPATPPAPGRFACPNCAAPSANRQGIVAHMRMVHKFSKPQWVAAMAAAGM
ncbi:MAG: AAA family ATPase [Bryobacteraceae bacterium]|jgi:replication-associated recombination protein RarA